MSLIKILNKEKFDLNDINYLLNLTNSNDIEQLRIKSVDVLLKNIGNNIYIRGLIEFSNYCSCDCIYCGIRKSNPDKTYFQLSKEEILSCADWAAAKNLGSIVLQSGERQDDDFIDFVVDIIKSIKDRSRSYSMPNGLGITLAVGEQTKDTYQKFYDAGAHRYLLRIETSNPNLYKMLHPHPQSFNNRVNCIKNLKDIGFKVGTGVMIGLPEQTIEDLANDIMFFEKHDIDMIGMGPFIPHKNTPLGDFTKSFDSKKQFLLSLKMFAIVRIVLKDVNIASTTALETLNSDGRKIGLNFGANVIMPQITPDKYKKEYLLYDKKPTINEQKDEVLTKMQLEYKDIGREIAFGTWGDPIHTSKQH